VIAVIYVAICSLMITGGQVLWKIAIDKNGGLINPNLGVYKSLMAVFLSPYMLIGLLLYAFATFFWMYLLGKYQYSYIYPMFSMTYVFSFLFAIFLFGEPIDIYKWTGLLFIIIGIYFITR